VRRLFATMLRCKYVHPEADAAALALSRFLDVRFIIDHEDISAHFRCPRPLLMQAWHAAI